MAGYSGTPLPKKLGIKGDVALINAPDGFAQSIGVEPAPLEDCDVVILFAASKRALDRSLKKAAAAMKEDGNLWIAWPKKSSRVPTDVTENLLRAIVLGTGLVDNKVCAIDEVWSGLRLVWRLERRAQRS